MFCYKHTNQDTVTSLTNSRNTVFFLIHIMLNPKFIEPLMEKKELFLNKQCTTYNTSLSFFSEILKYCFKCK